MPAAVIRLIALEMVGTLINDMADNCTDMIDPRDFLYLPALMPLVEDRLGPNLALERGYSGTTVDAQARQRSHKAAASLPRTR